MKAQLYHDEDVQIFKHYLELCDDDPLRAFASYRDQYILPLRQEVSELRAKAKRRRSDAVSDISHFIEYVKNVEQGEDIDWKSYLSYCKSEKIKPKFKDSKFYELRPFAIRRILVDDMPKHFSLKQAEKILRDNEWRIHRKYIQEALEDTEIFIELPMTDNERRAFLGTDDDITPIYTKAITS
jgi:hypothetical protein